MILNQNQKVNIVTRAIIINQDHLLITKWKDSFSFLIGGRVDFGEPLEESVIREIYEETKMEAKIRRLLYFNENVFNFKGIDHHEYGWYYLVDIMDWKINIGDIIQNPDSSNLIIKFIPLNKLEEFELYPPFLTEILAEDAKRNFNEAPKHIYSNTLNHQQIIKTMHKTL